MFENRKIKIAIAGIGGIGGYIGGKLAKYYSSIENVEIIFIARGEMAAFSFVRNSMLLPSSSINKKFSTNFIVTGLGVISE